MFASWPMVIGALIAGVLVGLLVPSPKPPASTSSPAAATQASSEKEKAEAKAKRDLAALTPKESGSAKEVNEVRTVAVPATEAKVSKQDASPCSQQTWPYYSPSCIDRSAPAPSSFRVTNTRPADPSIALRDEEKKQVSAPEAARDARQAPKAIPAAPTQTAVPVQTAAPAQAATPTAPTPAQTPARAPASPNPRAPDNAQAASADVERQVEQPRQRQQPRGQPRYTRIEPPDDDESPRVMLRGDGTRIYVMPEGRSARPINGYWRSW
jgi:hypothetical protein